MKIRPCLFLPVMLCFVFLSCKKTDVSTDTDTAPTEVQKPDFAYNVKAGVLLDMVNQVRAAGCNCGSTFMPPVSALTWNDELGKAAFAHSEDMLNNNYFSHTGSDNTNAGQRVTAEGYIWSICGENIAWGQTDEQLVMNSWLKSEGHCKNIMNKSFKEMGAGRSDNYWTQVFAAKQ
ncbi:MAG: CAP domain-containing protein [Agriterribacter sp.]